FLLDFSPDFATGRIIPLPFDIPVEQWPTLEIVAPPVIESADGYTGTEITLTPATLGGTASESAVQRPQWEADGVAIPGATGASFTPDASYDGKAVRCRIGVEGWTLVAYSDEITVVDAPDVAPPQALTADD